jgi:Uncharacterized protein conserved in bacteria (DUF2188)
MQRQSHSPTVRVVPVEHKGQQVWAIHRDGASRASRVYPSRLDAVAVARRIARRERAEMFVQDLDGTTERHDPTVRHGKVVSRQPTSA